MIPAITVCVGAVVRRDDQVLFVRQTYGDNLTGVWTLPWGYVDGVDPNNQLEPPHMAALREVLEEGGITADIEGFLGLQNHAAPSGDLRLYLLYLCRHRSGDPTPDGHETDRAAYFSLDDLASLSDPIDDFCVWLVCRVLRGEFHLIPPNLANPYAPHAAFL
ncbi:MAG TPA: NUDIX domain-containing protein [Aggregatilineaceae bacterium]|nr:NUDIX domain-containing protein [Aggregatilineaceae bacterium]